MVAAATKALELDPGLVDARVLLADALRRDWQWAKAEDEYKRAIELSPSDAGAREGLAAWLLCQGRTEDALIGAKQFDEAITTLEKASSLSDRSSAVLGVLVRAYAGAGRRTEALQVLDELRQRRQKGYVPPAAFLNAYLGLGDKEEAFAWLERSAEERSNIMQFLKVHPFFDLIRSDPRFAEYLRRANFSPN